MEASELEKSLRQLDDLARLEYHESLAEIVTRAGDSDEKRLLRLGRLLGVTLKEPFANGKALDVPASFSGAYRAWDLKGEGAFEESKARGSREYKTLEALRSNPDVIDSLGWQPASVYALAKIAQTERGFFWCIAMSCRRYLCHDPKLRTRIESEIQGINRAGVDLKNVTPELIVASGGLTIGATLVQSIPALGLMGAPVIAGVVFILYSIGIDAFCRWAADHASYHADFPNPDKEE